jgi:thiamine kinase-like enzyme
MSDHTMDLPPAASSGMAPNPANGRAEVNLALEIRRFLDYRRIEAAIPPSLRREGLKVERYERIGGLTNRNYKLHQGENALVLRLPGRGTGRFIDRRSERANQEAAARAGFTPQSIFFDGKTGVKITHYLQGAVALDAQTARKPERSAAVADLLSRFHSSGIHFVKDFNVFKMAKTYERVARGRFARFYDCFPQVRARVLALEPALQSIAGKPVACHNDLVPENILSTPSGLTLIDWEYSGMNDPAWDLASFVLESAFDSAEEARFLEAYHFKAPGRELPLRVEAYKMLQDYLWSLWSLLQESASREPERARYYRNYGRFRYERALVRLPVVEAGLAGLSGLGKGGAA